MSFVQQASDGAFGGSAGPSSEPPGRFLYCYVTENGRETEDQDMAEVDIGQTGVSYLVKCRTSDLQKYEKKHTVARGKSSSGILNFECYQLSFALYNVQHRSQNLH